MLAGERCQVNPTKFQNDMSVIQSKDDVLTVLIPRKNVDSPAIILELKVNQDTGTALDQIRCKQYPARSAQGDTSHLKKVADYADRLLLVGINYDRETKQHICRIERR